MEYRLTGFMRPLGGLYDPCTTYSRPVAYLLPTRLRPAVYPHSPGRTPCQHRELTVKNREVSGFSGDNPE